MPIAVVSFRIVAHHPTGFERGELRGTPPNVTGVSATLKRRQSDWESVGGGPHAYRITLVITFSTPHRGFRLPEVTFHGGYVTARWFLAA